MTQVSTWVRIGALALAVAGVVAIAGHLKWGAALGLGASFLAAALFRRAAWPVLAATMAIGASALVFRGIVACDGSRSEPPTMPIGATVGAAIIGPIAALFILRWYARRRERRAEKALLVAGALGIAIVRLYA